MQPFFEFARRKYVIVIAALLIITGIVLAFTGTLGSRDRGGATPENSFPDGSAVSDGADSDSSGGANSPASTGNPYPASADEYPQSETLTLGAARGSLTVKNFYRAMVREEDGIIVLADHDTHAIGYDPTWSEFYIRVDAQPFSSFRAAAENELLRILDIGQREACELKIKVGVSYEVSIATGVPVAAPLSFCFSQAE